MGEEKTVVSVLLLLYYSYDEGSKRLGNSYMYIGNDGTPWSTSLTLVKQQPIHEGGIIIFDQPLTGRYFALRRIGPGLPGGTNHYTISEIKLYGTPNLLNEDAKVLESPDPT